MKVFTGVVRHTPPPMTSYHCFHTSCEHVVDDESHIECGKPASVWVGGEQDSFGVEWRSYCQEHSEENIAAHRAEEEKPQECDWCGKTDVLVPTFDCTESGGPLYHLCEECRDKNRDQMDWDDDD